MPTTVRLGSSGDTVRLLQMKLNFSPPTSLPLLNVDGIFGSKTLARVKEFQRNNQLTVDGVVGPHTWDELEDTPPPKPRTAHLCGNGLAENAGNVQHVVANFLQFLAQSSSSSSSSRTTSAVPAVQRASFVGSPASASAGGGVVRSSFVSGLLPSSPFVRITAAQIAVARTRYGSSIDFSRVFLSPLLGIGSRPFTAAVPIPSVLALATGLSGTILVMNCGTVTPGNKTLLHELAHVWQSQHDSDPTRFMSNSVKCQAGALAFNAAAAVLDPSVRTAGGSDFPAHFPASAYAFRPGQPFSSYSCEQMANALDNAEPAVSGHVKSAAANTVDSDNVTGLSSATFDDRRAPGVVI